MDKTVAEVAGYAGGAGPGAGAGWSLQRVKIQCPTCAFEQPLAPAVCSGCNESLAGNLYRKYRKPLMSATTALIVGAYGGYKVTDTL